MWKIIICDDESLSRNGLRKMIHKIRNDMEVVSDASNGQQAIACIEKYHPSIVLMDINMPLISGLEVIERYAHNPLIRFVIISGYSDFEYAQKACRYHVVDYLLKPVSESQLNDVLSRCIALLQLEIQSSRIIVPEHQNRSMITQVLQEIDNHLSECTFSLQMLSEQFHVSSSYLSRIIKEEVHTNFSDLVTQKRLAKARCLLINHPNALIWEISEQCGFTSQHYFARVFKQHFGMTPQQYRLVATNDK